MSFDFNFDILSDFLSDVLITDINYNGKDLWIDHLAKGRVTHLNYASHDLFMNVCARFANAVNLPFNAHSPLLESDFKDLRVSIIHPSVGGRLSLSIRKTPMSMRMSEEKIIEESYMSLSALKFLRYVVSARCNVMISGMPGAGKTELLKFLTQYISPEDRVISIEDSYEIRYQQLHPNRDCVSMRVSERFSYDDAIKASLRQRPNWVLLSEVRGAEVLNLLNSVSTGTHLISTIHAKNAFEIPRRLLYMLPNADLSSEILMRNIQETIDIGIHIDLQVSDSGIRRYVREIVSFSKDDPVLVYHFQTKKLVRGLPEQIKERGQLFGVKFT